MGVTTDAHGDSPGLLNLRDLGGLPAEHGRTRHTVLYRSDVPVDGDGTPRAVAAWPPATVLDLRAPMEARSVPHPLAALGARVHTLPILDDEDLRAVLDGPGRAGAALDGPDRAGEDIAAWYTARYERWVAHRGDRLAAAARLAAHGHAPVLVHCSAGRDRTGVLVAVLLAAAGVDRDAIVADYRATEPNHDRLVDRLIAHGVLRGGRDSRLPRTRLATPQAIERVLDRLAEYPGGAAGWLVDHGADPADVHTWRDRLVSRPR